MSAHVSGLEIMNEDQLIKEVLDKFLNCHEQTNDEEFLNTFAHHSQEDLVSERGVFGTDSSENIFTSAKVTHKNEANNCHLRNKTIFLRTSSQCLEEQVNNFLDLEDLDMDEEIKPQMSEDGGVVSKKNIHNYIKRLLKYSSPFQLPICICCYFQEKWSRLQAPAFLPVSLLWPSLPPVR
ncbi:PREDICTED: uncharacterized protein C11orf74 homolog isoform X2 [Cercocebus atys]|uniref:uncharacterized protein C11orf74 homolog isoform X2 n=1 Tax=Cercocebus atys TaxID=9531 RepID=UPI0005F4FFF6|nr:PREDICTED: uncharacterized protein C11orf74 homolog isoform X2 [Cercocebus atys]